MRRFVSTIVFLLLCLVPLTVGASNEVSFSDNTDIYFTATGITITVLSGSVCDSVELGTSNVVFTLSVNSSVTLKSSEGRQMDSTLSINNTCNSDGTAELTLPGQGSATEITVTPTSVFCPTGGGGVSGGGPVTPTPTPSMPTTTTGKVTATASAGGKTTVTSAENTTATVEMPAGAVSVSTEVAVTPTAKSTIATSAPAPAGKSVVGGYVYNLTATADRASVSTFAKALTITLSYTASQIAGLNENTLKIHYWDEATSKWITLVTTIDKINKKLSTTVTHFTYFAILGEPAVGEELPPEEPGEAIDTSLKEGDLIRGPDGIKVYIINAYGYKRHIFNPAVFGMYRHFTWGSIKGINQATLDSYTTSDLYRADGDYKVYSLEEIDEAAGKAIKHWLDMTAEQFVAKGYSWEQVFIVNSVERDYYATGAEMTY